MKEDEDMMSRLCGEQEMRILEDKINFCRKKESEIHLERQRRKMNKWLNRRAGLIKRVLERPSEIPYINMSRKT